MALAAERQPVLDVQAVRDLFPILEQRVHGKPLVYLDNAATTQRPRAVLDAMAEFYESYNANVHRGIYAFSEKASARYEEVRSKVQALIGAAAPEEIVFTRGTTEALNLVAQSWGRANLREGDEILVTEMEHHSNFVPWQMVAKETGARLRCARVTDEGRLDREDFRANLTGRTRIVALAHVSNVLGTINPVADLAREAHTRGAIVVVDGAQAAGHLPVDVRALGCDFYAFSAHKMYGPTGVGALYGRLDLLDAMEPTMGGGGMIGEVTLERTTWADVPHRFEAGTMPIAEVIALGAAVDFLLDLDRETIRAHEERLTSYALARLKSCRGVKVFGPPTTAGRAPVLSLASHDVHPHDLATVMDRDGVAVRAGHHCAQPLMRRLGVGATARASFALYNTTDEVDAFIRSLEHAEAFFRGS
ncbi:MAG: cysteine desulfurase [Nitrospirae bacterium]|nr:cysteine desulfurase [Nitrospirota bacterium]